uniref:Uncharacterized protein n=1 Tax=Arundo donax TaxID=35708 RepID=A0A0A8Z6U2_ARUDO
MASRSCRWSMREFDSSSCGTPHPYLWC